MALAIDNSTVAGYATGVSTYSWSHACQGANRVLFVGVAFQGTTLSVTGITYNGAAMTEEWDHFAANIGSAGYILANPDTGSNTIHVTLNASVDVVDGGSVSFTGADTASPVRTPVSTNGGSATASVNASDAASGDIVVDCAYVVSNGITVGADQTSRSEVDAIGGGASSFGISTQNGASGGVMSWTLDQGANSWSIGAVAIKAAAAAAGQAIASYFRHRMRLA